jgi:3-hydroxyacyl-CoA dehydrogenase / 3-hydroxy-2-methylbutyryl-CoA dehydrogenase
MRPDGAVVLVTGAASGLGLGVSKVLHERGARVVVVDLPSSAGAEVVAELGEGARFAPCDITDPAQVEAVVPAIIDQEGRLDCVVSCAGIMSSRRVLQRDGTLHPVDAFARHLAVNVTGTFDVVRQSIGVMSTQEPNPDGERGLVVNIASIAAYEGQIGQVAYAASKGAVASMTLPLARELGSLGIRVVAIAPGTMDTPMLGTLGDDAREQFAAANAFPKRLGTPADLGGMVVAVMENVFLNGETIRFDAGLRMGPR